MLDPSIIARRVRGLRQDAKMRREELAVKAGVSASTIDNLEQGRGLPQLETLDRVAAALRVPLVSLLVDEDEAASRGLSYAGCAA